MSRILLRVSVGLFVSLRVTSAALPDFFRARAGAVEQSTQKMRWHASAEMRRQTLFPYVESKEPQKNLLEVDMGGQISRNIEGEHQKAKK